MKTKFTAGMLIILLVAMSIPGDPKKRIAHADGATDPEQVFIEWRETDWTGQAAAITAQYSVEAQQVATYMPEFNLTGLDVDYINITQIRAYIEWDGTNDAFSGDWYFTVYEYVAVNDAGALLHLETWNMQNLDGTPLVRQWNTRVLSEPFNLSQGDYFLGVESEAHAGSIRLQGTNAGHADSGWIVDKSDPIPNDPFIEVDAAATEEFSIQLKYSGFKEELTEENIFIGNATHNTARRDLNYTFPAGVENEQIQMTYPIDEAILNITRYNGGAWNDVLAEADYSTAELNGTHYILTIPEATINSYGGLYRVYTSTYDFYYEIGGAFWENGTSYGPVNITATTEGGGSNQIEVDGTTIYAIDEAVILFQWDVGTAVRFYYTRTDHEQFNVYFPEDTYATYEFEIRDLTGDLQSHDANSHLESLRYVNNSLDIIERVAIADVVNDVPLTLVTYQVYRLRVLHPDEHIINFGILVSGVISNPILVIDEIEFSQQAQITYQYVTVESIRASPTQITVNYNDSLAMTDSVSFYLEFRNGTDVYNETVADDNYQFNFAGADAYTDYRIVVVITHGFFGTLTHEEIVSVARTFNPAPSWSIMGTVGPIGVGNLMSLFVCLVMALGFSAVNAEVGGFSGLALAFVLRYWGWNTFDYTTIGICMGIVLVVGMVRRST